VAVQRLRVAFVRGEPIRFISHLDLLRLWERALRRARVPLAYTQGFNPHPRLSLASPLAVGVIGERELMDVYLAERIESERFRAAVSRQMPEGLRLLDATEVDLNAPALPAQVRAAEYVAELTPSPPAFPSLAEGASPATKGSEARPPVSPARGGEGPAESYTDLEARVAALQQATALPRERKRDKEVRRYDLRPLIEDLRVERSAQGISLWMRLRADPSGTGRPDEVLAALGIPIEAANIRRQRLILDERR